ncbi:nicotinate-nucleotide--dimethylbenzimidazole phosphoribosyltransferase [Elusimicrobiota bacterium]
MEDLNKYISCIRPVDLSIEADIQKKLDSLTKPLGSLGRLEDLAKKYCLIRRTVSPVLKEKIIFTLAADHGVTVEGVSAYPGEVTPQMVLNFISGGAGINVLAGHTGSKVIVVDMGVRGDINSAEGMLVSRKIKKGTDNIAQGPAMSEEEAVRSIKTGIELAEEQIKKGADIIGTGDMGIGNTTPSSAIVSAVTGVEVSKVTGKGTGINDEILKNKIEVIEKALDINKPDKDSGIDVLSKIGGFEIGGLTGIILACAANNIPVVIDGFISGAAALIACQLRPSVKEYMIASHCSVEQGHKVTLDHIGLKPLLDLNLRLGEGTGAALGIYLVEAGIKLMNEMATFESAGVSEKNE